MGAGQTTIGKALSKRLGLMFYDLDWYIESRMHKTIAQIFADDGEEGFREIEYNMLHEVAEFENVIVSCGGGTPCLFDNRDYLNAQGETIYLQAAPEVLAKHLKMGKVVRPLIVGKTDEELLAYISESLEKREPYYSRAKHILNVDLLNTVEKVEESVDEVCRTLQI